MQKIRASLLCMVAVSCTLEGWTIDKASEWRMSIRSREDLDALVKRDPEAATYFSTHYSKPEDIDVLIRINHIVDSFSPFLENNLYMMNDARMMSADMV